MDCSNPVTCWLLLQMSDRRGQQMQDLEVRLAQAEAAVAVVLPDVDILGPVSAPVAVAPILSAHSTVLSAEQIERVQSSLHLGLLRSILRGSQDRSQSRATSSVAQPTLRPPDGGCEGSGKSGAFSLY